MLQTSKREIDELLPIEQLLVTGDSAPSLDAKLELCRHARKLSSSAGEHVDRLLLAEIEQLRGRLSEARDCQEQLRAIVDRLTLPPCHSALLLGLAPGRVGTEALVWHAGGEHVVALAHDLDPTGLAVGDTVLLGRELNVLLARSPYTRHAGETALVERHLEDGRAVVRFQNDQLVVELAGGLAASTVKAGDLVRWNRQALVAFERIERSQGGDLFLEETPRETFADIGGLSRQIDELQRSIRLHLYHSDIVRRYRLRRKGSVLFVGPPGNGKTMLAKALANWIAQLSRSGRSRFISVKPAGLHSKWYGETEQNYREAFRIAREAGKAEPDVPVVMFFDEIDAIGAVRGHSSTHVDDRVLTAFMTELDGLEARGNILVVAATNRRDALDPALLRPGRLGDLELEVPRPNMAGAREILDKHLPGDIPYRTEAGKTDQDARRRVLDVALSRLYAPNAGNELATLLLRDGRQQTVRPADLLTGASLAKIAADAAEIAGRREEETGERGVREEDALKAIAVELDRLARALTPASCRAHVDLPQDVDVVRVDPIRRQRVDRLMNVA